jgi:hypothetical protein
MKFLLAMLVLLAALVFCAAASEPKIAAPYGFNPSSLLFRSSPSLSLSPTSHPSFSFLFVFSSYSFLLPYLFKLQIKLSGGDSLFLPFIIIYLCFLCEQSGQRLQP